MNGVKFGNKHSYDDWDLILTKKVIGLPEPKTSSIDIEGADGSLDITEVLGEVKFKNRTLAFEFALQDKYEDFDDKLDELTNYLHGKKMSIILDSDEEHYYVGRCSINQFSTDRRIGKIVIYCDCEPYKYDRYASFSSKKIKGSGTMVVKVTRKTISPNFICSAPMTLKYDGATYDLEKGDNYLDVYLKQGDNYLKFTGTGSVTIDYKGGAL